jgi:hypothetical protein
MMNRTREEGRDEVRGVAVRARLGLAILLGGIAVCLAVALTKGPAPSFLAPTGMPGDSGVFHTIVSRVHDGDSFYDATQEELRGHGYPTRSVFNWRTPCYALMLGRVTGLETGRWLLLVGAMTALGVGIGLLGDCGPVSRTVGAVFLFGALTGWCLGGKLVMSTELWAAMLIVLSVGALHRGWTPLGVGLGLVAVFYRELALPYAAVSMALAVLEGRRREAVAWGLGLALFAAFMAWHTSVVLGRLTDVDWALEGGWVRFGGVHFLLTTTADSNLLLEARPLWATALYLPMACLGLAGMKGGTGRRLKLTGLAYLAAFAVAGNPFNSYWGFVNAPILALGFGYAPGTLRSLVAAAFPRGISRGRIDQIYNHQI